MSMSSNSTLETREAARHLLRRVRTARDAGLDTLTFGDGHNRSTTKYFQNVPTLARALAEWDPARPAGCLFLAPMWSPVLMAEQIGTLAAFHDGPFIVQTGLGGPPRAFDAMGVPYRPRGDAVEESIELVRRLFAGETVSSERYGIVDASFALVPPHGVEWWMGTMAPAGLDRAARLGATWYASHGATRALFPELRAIYLAACADAGTTPQIAMRRDAVVLDDGDRARRLADQAIAAGYRGLEREMIVAGTPAEVAAEVAPFGELGVDEVLMRTIGASPEDDIRTIEGLGEVRELLA